MASSEIIKSSATVVISIVRRKRFDVLLAIRSDIGVMDNAVLVGKFVDFRQHGLRTHQAGKNEEACDSGYHSHGTCIDQMQFERSQ